MNDRFKFRVWDSSANAYVPRSQFVLLSDGTLIQEIGGEEVIWESTQPEFCTGLKDKNGKLIYEGDIVKKEFKNKPFSSKAKTKEKLIKFKWNDVEACFSFDFLNEKDKHDDFQCWESGWKDKYSDDEIIGNIHENADLLEINND